MKVQTFFICSKGNHTHTLSLSLTLTAPLQEDNTPVRAYNCNTNQSPTIQLNKEAVKIQRSKIFRGRKKKETSKIILHDWKHHCML